MKDNVTKKPSGQNGLLTVPSSELRYFAGFQFCDDTVSGGTGATIEDAVADYLHEHAEYEAVDYACLGDGEEFTVEIYNTFTREDFDKDPDRLDFECWEDGWDFMLNKLVDKRTFEIRINDGDVTFIPQSNKDSHEVRNERS